MNTKQTPLFEIKMNNANPRIIKDGKFQRLIASLLVFPRMLELRPLVVDESGTILGGNMRYRALIQIAQEGYDDTARRLEKCKDYTKKSDKERKAVLEFWASWHDNPTAPVVNASDLSDDEKVAFIIKDNASFGDWDWDRLANEWDGDDLVDWGIDLWKSEETKQVKDLSEKLSECFKIEIDCGSETSQKELFNELEERGLKCRLLTL